MKVQLKLTEIVDEWISSLDVLAATKRDYRRKLALWFRYLSANDINTRTPSRSNVLAYKSYLLEQKYSVYTINSLLCMVRIFYGWCEDRKWYRNIGAGVKSIKSFGDYAKYPLSNEQTTQLMESFDLQSSIDLRDKLMVGLMLFNGLRTCEVERIDVGDFDILEGEHIVRIQRKGRHEKGELIVLHDEIVNIFNLYIADRTFTPQSPLFASHKAQQSNRLSRQAISHIVKKRMRDVGINDSKLTPHSLRHTYGTMLVESGVDIETVRDMMGHADSKTTRIYVGLAQKRKLLKQSPSKLIYDKIFNH